MNTSLIPSALKFDDDYWETASDKEKLCNLNDALTELLELYDRLERNMVEVQGE